MIVVSNSRPNIFKFTSHRLFTVPSRKPALDFPALPKLSWLLSSGSSAVGDGESLGRNTGSATCPAVTPGLMMSTLARCAWYYKLLGMVPLLFWLVTN